MSATKIKEHNCHSPFQDERYGRNRRVFNEAKGSGTSIAWMCTVCGKPATPEAVVKTAAAATEEPKKKAKK